MNGIEEFVNGVLKNGGKYFLLTLGVLAAVVILGWFVRVRQASLSLLKAARDVLGPAVERKDDILRLLCGAGEVEGVYKGRDVCVGVAYTGMKNEYLPLPHIRMRLKEAVGYNTNRLPHYARIEKNILVFVPKLNLAWGIFDQGFLKAFGKSYLIVALEKMLASAEDLERGRGLDEILR